MTEKRIEYAVRQAKATLAIEGLKMSKADEELIKRKLRGEISRKEFMKRCREMIDLGV